MESDQNAELVDEHRSQLIQRVTMVMSIADELLAEGMIHKEMYSNISAARTDEDKMRELFKALHSGGNKVKSAFLSILRENEPNLVQDLESHIKQGDQQENKSTISLKYKEFIRGEYATVQEYNSLPGEHVKLDDRYTEPLIIQKHRQQREREEEIRSRGQNFHHVMDQRDSEAYKSTKVERLFDPDEHGDIQRTVILQGHSGTGKSFTSQKIMSDWAFGRLYEDRFDFVFHLRCKELNQATGRKSLMDLLDYDQGSSSMINQVLHQSPERVLFLVDGFDELKFSLDVPKDSLPRDPWTQCSPEVTLSGLIRKQILHESFLLVTTRSTALVKLIGVVKHPVRYAEILGFSEEGVKVYFEKFFKQKQLSQQAYDFVRENETLFTACFIPVICWIICTVYREQFDEGTEMIQSLETTTSIFVEFVDTLLKHHCQDLGQSALTILQGLGKLAEKGMEEQQVLFDHDSVSQTVSDPSKVPFLCMFLQKKRASQTTMYMFMHLRFQEFFTALSYMSLGDEEAQGKVRELLSKVRCGPQHFHLLPIVQFLFGILNKEVAKRLEEKHISCSQGIWTQLKHFILEVIEKGKEDQIVRRTMQLFTFHCLYELHTDDFVKEAMETYTDINMSGSPLKKTDCWVLMYCLQHCKSIECLELSGCNLTAENMKILLPALQKCKALVLQVDDLADDDLDGLLTALGEGKSLELDLRNTNFSDEKVQDLLVALTKHKTRKVQTGVKSITRNTADKFMSLISKAHGVLDLIKLHSCGNVALSVQLQKDGVRAPQIILWLKVPEMKMICDSIRTSGYSLTGVKLRVRQVADERPFLYPTNNCRLMLHIDWPLRCGVEREGQQHSALSSIEMSLYDDDVFDWRRIHQLCQTLKHKPEWDEHADELISLLHSQTSLGEIVLLVSSLTERCAASVIRLSQACSKLKDIILQVNGFLLEEGIQCLRESKRRPDCQLLLLGRRCRKLADQCSEEKDKRLSCNDNVLLALHGESFIEIVLRRGNENDSDDTWNGNENDSDDTWNGNENDSDDTWNGNENDRPRDDIKCKGCCVVGYAGDKQRFSEPLIFPGFPLVFLCRSVDAELVDEHRSQLIQRVTMVMSIADELLAEGMIHKEMYSNISAARTDEDKMRELFKALHSGGNKVKSAFLSILRENEPNLVQDLESHIKQGDQQENKSTISLKYKEFIRGEYATVQEYNSLPGEHVKLDDRYTEPLIIQKHRQQREREEEIRSRGQNFHHVMDQRDSEAYKSTKVERLFDPDEHRDIQRTVILQGHSGTGKSFTSQKIMSDWAFGRLYEDRFDFVFHLRCKELNQATGRKSLMDLLDYDQSSSSMIKQVLHQSPERVLFLVDGFDELKFSLDVPKDSLPRDPWTQCSPEVTLSGLILKHILPESFLLVTTRSTALVKLIGVLKHPVRYAEILGFSEKGVKVYFEKFFKQKQHSHQAYDFVRENETLFTACFIPVICWIICTVYREQFDEGTEMIQSLETTTSIFVEFVDTLLKHHCQDLGQSALTILQGLGKLAEKGMEEQQVSFDHDCVSQTVSDPSKVPFLCKFLQKKRVSQTTMYSFMHLSFQEFFTALSYMLLGDEEAQEKVRELLSKVRLGKENSHLLPIVQFLFGIANKEVGKRLEDKKHISCSQGIWTQLKHFILEVIEKGKEDQIVRRTMQLFTFHCLYELHADDFVKEAMETYTDIHLTGTPMTNTDCWVLRYCLQHCKSIESLGLSGCNLTAENMKMLSPGLRKCKDLVLQVDDLADDDLDGLLTALGEGKSLELDLHKTNFSDEKVQDLLVCLTKHKTRKVKIGVKSITRNTADKFMSLINKAHGVLESIELHSCGNVALSGQLQKDGVRTLQTHLRLKVSELRMICVFIRASGYSLSDVELTVRCVADLSDTDVDDLLAIILPVDKLRFTIEHNDFNDCDSWSDVLQFQSAVGSIELTLSDNPVFDLRSFFHLFHTQHPEWDEHVDELISLLHHDTSLEEITLMVSSMTERCATSVVRLSQACPNLTTIFVNVIGFLLEDGIQCLRESKTLPDCTLVVTGQRCRKATVQCTDRKDWMRSCNEFVQCTLEGETFSETDCDDSPCCNIL
ncbi:uncharacterized protein LOC135518934 [Oncorhynchus masou masou]|uniref:uncharacterized protein LOC135518934 n=1 Tax=Oncorhynchus masou masou TaxID=90313 RepID=UPI0031836F6B